MPWKELVVPDQRMRFVLACLDQADSMTTLCARFGVSRRVGYKWLARYKESGPAGLADRSRAPHAHPNRVEAAVERRILALRADHPTWGARKLLAHLARRCEAESEPIDLPAASTVGDVLRRAGLVAPRRRRRSTWAPPGAAADRVPSCAAGGPNRLWCADFKGWFRTGDGARCEPLTVTDAHSRYLLRCRIVPGVAGTGGPGGGALTCDAARGQFEAVFRAFGLPDAIRTDNGSPFASTGVAGLSRLSAWWVRLGIAHQRIEPGRPQQNGSHERMHGTLARETARPPAASLRAQQARFDAWAREYNEQRPHEGLPGMATPASLYAPSARALPARLPELVYPRDWHRRGVDVNGKFSWGGSALFLSHALAQQTVGLSPWAAAAGDGPDDGGWPESGLPAPTESRRYWLVYFGPVELGVLDVDRGRLLRDRERRYLAG
jgi:transposase InsO family protein